MHAKLLTSLLVIVFFSSRLAADPPPWSPGEASRTGEFPIERWADRLASEIDHLQEDLHYEQAPAGLIRQVDRASRAVAHFQEVLSSSPTAEHLSRDFREMDRQVHELVEQLARSGDSWLARQASRIRYADEQIHYLVRGGSVPGDGRTRPDVLARHARVLQSEARQLARIVARDEDYGGRQAEFSRAVRQFADQAEHFHRSVEQGARAEHLRNDYQNLDRTWHWVVNRLNESQYAFSVLRTAQRVNRVHNQIHDMVGGGPHQHGAEERAARRPQLEFEIPGIGRVRLR